MADTPDSSRREIEKGRQDVANIRSAIKDKLAILEERVEETVEAVKHSVDFQYQMKQRPWLILGGAVLLGYALGRRGGRSGTPADAPREPPAFAQAPPQRGLTEVTGQIKDDLAVLKGAALGAVTSTLWAMAKQVLVPSARQVTDAFVKPGAQPAAKSPTSETTTNGITHSTSRGPK